MISFVIGTLGTITKELVQGIENKRTNREHPNNSIDEISLNTEESSRDLSRLAVTQTPVRNHLLTLV